MFHCSLDLRSFRQAHARMVDDLTSGVGRAVENAAREGAREARAVGQFQDRTGQLRANIAAYRVSEGFRRAEWLVDAPVPYARFVEAGTRPHPIYPKRANYLTFYWPKVGHVVHLKKVNHPGSRPFPFMGPGLLKAERVLFRDLEVLVMRSGKHFGGGGG